MKLHPYQLCKQSDRRGAALSVSKWESPSRHSSSINSLIFLDCIATDHDRSLPRSLHSEQKAEEGKNTHPLENTNACINAFCSKGFCGAFRSKRIIFLSTRKTASQTDTYPSWFWKLWHVPEHFPLFSQNSSIQPHSLVQGSQAPGKTVPRK